MADDQNIKLCECGCGQPAPIAKQSLKKKGWVKGQPLRVIARHGRPRKPVTIRPRKLTHEGQPYVSLYRIRAERALGHPLPNGAVVHHVDEDPWNDNARLVICQDAAYHRLLHRRMRVKAAGGNPNTDAMCSRCQKPKQLSEFTWDVKKNLPQGRCHQCVCEYYRERRAVKRA
jgi:hypothetical protein